MAQGRRTDYPTAALAMELQQAGYSERQIAAQTGLPAATVHGIVSGANGWNEIAQEPVFRQYRAQQNKALEQAARSLAAKSFIHAETQLPKASYYQAVVGGSILLDKARLLAGEPTEIHATLDVPELARVKALAASLAKYVVEQSQAIDVTPTDKEQCLK